MTPLRVALEARFRRGGPIPDTAQGAALDHLARLADALVHRRATRGLFLWGGVGRGKTRLMACLDAVLPPAAIRRYPLNALLGAYHATCVCQPDWAARLDTLFGSARVLLLDEFHAYDPADALVLERLLAGVAERGMVCVVTANHPPDRLWPDTPEHRARRHHFAPVAQRLAAQCLLLEVDGGRDYRELLAAHGPLRWWSATDATDRQAARRWLTATAGCARDFDELFCQPRPQRDYVRLAETADGLLIDGFPRLTPRDGDALRRLVWCLDAAWDAGLALGVLAEAAPETWVAGIGAELDGLLGKDLARARSRLRALCHVDGAGVSAVDLAHEGRRDPR